ncbi:hypothetical protein KEJ51_04150 [Candidatus Bathyarchaeota archaeon]|nr:hypothetical protein [Candidatus Bathyarchaeota archaeon]MBS7629257.1 hypothetical protein [Candidatus Bathyarchaeota archaeon]
MVSIRVFVTQISGERLWGIDASLPPEVQIAINVNLLGFERKSASIVEAPFVFTVSFTPSVAQISIKGRAQTIGEENELNKIIEDYKNRKPPPPFIAQAISNAAVAEAIVIAKTIGVPPPIPPISIPEEQQKPRPDARYTA